MKEILESLKAACGVYVGEGINHEGQPFTGRLSLEPLLSGRGFQLQFSATGKDGKLYHQEASTIAPAMNEKLTLWNFNTNIPGLVPHELRSASTKTGAISSLTFGFNSPQDQKAFREEVSLDIWSNTSISYTYSWGLPDGDFKERSGVRMTKKRDSFQSPQALFEKYKVEINKHNFDTLEPLITEDCKFWFSSGTFEGLEQTRRAFEKTWGMIKEEVYTITDPKWISESDQAAVCTYTFHWKGLINGEPGEGKGRGTSCFRKEGDSWKIVHEHLSHFPK
jgi:ketosteroid isomerase-like protein